MIRVNRARVPEPAALGKPYTRGKRKGKTELQVVLEALASHEKADRPLAEFKFDFERYKEGDVKRALDALFAGKCAYCETSYAASQPMDVEHWRPKAEIHQDEGDPLRPGYYWLASDWENLFPSCIDCNRARLQHDPVEGREILLGKANQFPVAVEDARIKSHDPEPEMGSEPTLLVNPCLEDPEELFVYTEEGVIQAREDLSDERRTRARKSIRVYALNRSGLVAERREVIRLVDHRLELIDRLADLRTRLHQQALPDLATVVEELIAVEVTALQAMAAPERPFAGLVRYLLREDG